MSRPANRPGAARLCAVALVSLLAAPEAATAYEAFDGRVQLHGFYRMGFGTVADGFERHSEWTVTQLSHTLNLELEWDVAPDGWGPFSEIGAYARLEVRFDCIWADGCGILSSRRKFGDKPSRAQNKFLIDGRLGKRSGFLLSPAESAGRRSFEGSTHLRPFFDAPPLDQLAALGAAGLEETFQPLANPPLVSVKQIDGGFDEQVFVLGPYNTNSKVQPIASLAGTGNKTSGLPLRPQVADPDGDSFAPNGLWVPSAALRRRTSAFENDQFGQRLEERELRWNHGQGQDENELKEAYLDLELLDGALFLRLGKQTVVWGKTELFRNQDQFNPQDIALSSLPSLEESRIALWSARAIYSLYNVGPFEDVRLEVAAILDEFEPIDVGRCGEPYSPFLVCALSFGMFGHGIAGIGVAGVDEPPAPWNSWKGLEVGGRLEFRYGRFSFAITDFYGYNDAPTANLFNEYARRVDVRSGRPLDVYGNVMDPSAADRNLLTHTGNRQLFDLACAVTVGIAAELIESLADECLVALTNNRNPIPVPIPGLPPVAAADALSLALTGTGLSAVVLGAIIDPDNAIAASARVIQVALQQDLNDGPAPAAALICTLPGQLCLSQFLTDQQEALLGCGPFYGTNCDVDGVDLFNAEASVLFQSFPQFEPGGPVATRYENGRTWILPGARGPDDDGYDPRIDGCVNNDHPDCAGARGLANPITGRAFKSEMGALSFNFLSLISALGEASSADANCDATDPLTCAFVRGVFGVAGIQHYDVRAGGNGRFGRRTFVWNGGGQIQLQFNKRNVLGFATDFAEDYTKTNWGIEMTWVENEALGVRTKRNGFRKVDVYNLTVSVDRPTIVNFLNQGRTLFFNSQWFFQYIPEYERGGTFTGANGPLSVLGTFSVFTAYFQDRLSVGGTFVHDFSSSSGGVIWNIGYRFSESFSASIGINIFYGGPEQQEQSLHPVAIGNNGGSFKNRTRFLGLTPIAERDEIRASIRYTF